MEKKKILFKRFLGCIALRKHLGPSEVFRKEKVFLGFCRKIWIRNLGIHQIKSRKGKSFSIPKFQFLDLFNHLMRQARRQTGLWSEVWGKWPRSSQPIVCGTNNRGGNGLCSLQLGTIILPSYNSTYTYIFLLNMHMLQYVSVLSLYMLLVSIYFL